MKTSTQKLCVTALGIALFVVLSLCLQAPVFENYYLCLGYAVMAVWCCCFGTASGTAVGVLGAALYCLCINGLRGMPGWALGNLAIGLILGFAMAAAGRMTNRPIANAFCAAVMVLAAAAGILVVKSAVEWIIYAQPFTVRMAKNVYGFIADAVMLVASLPICALLRKPARKIFPALAA